MSTPAGKRLDVVDCDLTLTKTHTFAEFQKTSKSVDAMSYQQGRDYALAGNLKIGVGALLERGPSSILALATYHNNAAFCAGLLSVALGKELTLIPPPKFTTGPHPIAINAYCVEGRAEPVFVSYIPAVGKEYQKTQRWLEGGGKNHQLEHLYSEVKKMGIKVDSMSLSDDSQYNIRKAHNDCRLVDRGVLIQCTHIDGRNPTVAARSSQMASRVGRSEGFAMLAPVPELLEDIRKSYRAAGFFIAKTEVAAQGISEKIGKPVLSDSSLGEIVAQLPDRGILRLPVEARYSLAKMKSFVKLKCGGVGPTTFEDIARVQSETALDMCLRTGTTVPGPMLEELLAPLRVIAKESGKPVFIVPGSHSLIQSQKITVVMPNGSVILDIKAEITENPENFRSEEAALATLRRMEPAVSPIETLRREITGLRDESTPPSSFKP